MVLLDIGNGGDTDVASLVVHVCVLAWRWKW